MFVRVRECVCVSVCLHVVCVCAGACVHVYSQTPELVKKHGARYERKFLKREILIQIVRISEKVNWALNLLYTLTIELTFVKFRQALRIPIK